ncbi:MAG: VOC family protein [Gemmatimonadetes bacterium]|nr:VOC family protein [Gemmatimonadota bacterium]
MSTVEKVIPLLIYRDIPAAHDFLVRVFGFVAGGVVRSPDGEPVHGEVRVGGTTIWLHRVTAEHELGVARMPSSGLVVLVEDVDAHYQHALAAGAQTDGPPTDQAYGQREYGVRDLEGHRWWFGTALTA